MKRFVAILLILVLVFALSATAFAAGSVTSPMIFMGLLFL